MFEQSKHARFVVVPYLKASKNPTPETPVGQIDKNFLKIVFNIFMGLIHG
jgi:hypothetical protein